MANNNIQFKIGSTFSGEGFKQARQAVIEVNKNVKQSAEITTKMASALGGLDTSASKAAAAIGGLFQAFAMGGVQGLVVSAVVMKMNEYFQKLKDEAAEVAERINNIKAAMERTFSNTLNSRMASINAEVKSIRDGFESVTKQANAMAAAIEGVRSANAKGGIAKLKIEELNKMLEAHTEAERQSIEKSYALQTAIAQREEVERAAAEKVSAAAEAVAQSQLRKANIDEAWAKASEERMALEETLAVAKASNDSHAIELHKRVNELKAKEAELLAQREEVDHQTQVLEVKRQEAIAMQTLETTNATLAVKQATLAHQVFIQQMQEKAAAEAQELADKKEKAALDRESKDIQLEVNAAAQELMDAEAAYAQALRDYQANFKTNVMNEGFDKEFSQYGGMWGTKKGAVPVDIRSAVVMKMTDLDVEKAIRDGVITSVKELEAFQKVAKRENTANVNKHSGQRGKEAKAYQDILNKNAKARNEAERQFLKNYEQIKKIQEEQKNKVEEAKKAVDAAKESQAKSLQHLQKLEQKVAAISEKLGLK